MEEGSVFPVAKIDADDDAFSDDGTAETESVGAGRRVGGCDPLVTVGVEENGDDVLPIGLAEAVIVASLDEGESGVWEEATGAERSRSGFLPSSGNDLSSSKARATQSARLPSGATMPFVLLIPSVLDGGTSSPDVVDSADEDGEREEEEEQNSEAAAAVT